MSSGRLSADLFAVARADAPSSAVRDQVWHRVAAATAVPAVATAAVKTVVAPATGKVLAFGTLIGAAGVAVLGYGIASFGRDAPAVSSRARGLPAVVQTGPAAGARLAETAPRSRAESTRIPDTPAPAAVSIEIGDGDEASALAAEARIVTEARMALVAHDATRALELVQSTHRLSARALEPEELGLELRALRALGRTDEALATELLLRRRFPEHALSR
ncbi:MAG TPA: hypothetical protein VM925_07710 [Labilithrix sp.]|nr:hypothetical protein [Labilithrix sp.]